MCGAGRRLLGPVICFHLVFVSLSASPAATPDFNKIYKKFQEKCYSNPANYITNSSIVKCNITFEGSCWPDTPAGMTVVQRCPFLFFRPDNNISRRCGQNGQWEDMDTGKCHPLNEKEATETGQQVTHNNENNNNNITDTETLNSQLAVYVAFNWISLILMVPSFILICIIINRQNDRFNIHKNLILSYILRIVTFFLYHYDEDSTTSACNVLWVLNRYFAVSEVTWMLIEAIFLLRMLVYPLDNESYFSYYFIFGWGFSGVLTFCVYLPYVQFVIARKYDSCWVQHGDTIYMLVLYIPMTIMLVINLAIMVFVVYTTVRKLKDSRTPQLVTAKKAAKAIIVLLPTLGIIYLIIFFIPTGNTGYDYFVRIVYPMQGILVCIFLVLLSSDVHDAVRKRWRKFSRTGDSGPYSAHPDRAEGNVRDGDSPEGAHGRHPAGNEPWAAFPSNGNQVENNASTDVTSSTSASQGTPSSNKRSSRVTLRSAGQRTSMGSLLSRSSDLFKLRSMKVEPESPQPVTINVGRHDRPGSPATVFVHSSVDGKPIPATAAWTKPDLPDLPDLPQQDTTSSDGSFSNLSDLFRETTGISNKSFVSHSKTDIETEKAVNISTKSLRSTDAHETQELSEAQQFKDKTEISTQDANKADSSTSDEGKTEDQQEKEWEISERDQFTSSPAWLFLENEVTDPVSQASGTSNPVGLPERGGRKVWAKIRARNKEKKQRRVSVQPTGTREVTLEKLPKRRHSEVFKEPEEYRLAWIRRITRGRQAFEDEDESAA